MTEWPRAGRLGDQAVPGILANATGLPEAYNDFCATLLAMAGHDLRQPLQVIVAAPNCWLESPVAAPCGHS